MSRLGWCLLGALAVACGGGSSHGDEDVAQDNTVGGEAEGGGDTGGDVAGDEETGTGAPASRALCPNDARFAAGDLDYPWGVALLFRAGAAITLDEDTRGPDPGGETAAPISFTASPDTEHESPADPAALAAGMEQVTSILHRDVVLTVEDHANQDAEPRFVDGSDMRLWFEVTLCPSQTRADAEALAGELAAVPIVESAEATGGPPPDMTPPGM